MAYKYNNLEELKRKKALLKKDISEMEGLLTFDNTKESLSVLTKGFTDQYLKEEMQPDGELKVALKTQKIVKEFSNNLKDNILNRNTIYNIAKSDAGLNVIENAIKIGAVTFVGNYARKSMINASWKKKALGFALIYLAPIALKFVREKLEDYQQKKTTSSLNQLI